jgi:hypothetical protein
VKKEVRSILESYKKNKFDAAVRNSFDVITREKNIEWLDVASLILSDIKSDAFVEETLRTVNYFRDSFQSENQKEEILNLIGKIALESSNSSEVRTQAIIQLGNLGTWTKTPLRSILEEDPVTDLKLFAFRAILTQLKLPESVISLEFKRALYGEIKPSFHEINRITQARADGSYDHLE